MASHYQSPHSGPGPGPSTYYMQPPTQTPPPQGYAYGGPPPPNSGPAGPNGYNPYHGQYAGPPPTHAQIAQMGPPHPGSSPRMNARGGGPNGNMNGNSAGAGAGPGPGYGNVPRGGYQPNPGYRPQLYPHPHAQHPQMGGPKYPGPGPGPQGHQQHQQPGYPPYAYVQGPAWVGPPQQQHPYSAHAQHQHQQSPHAPQQHEPLPKDAPSMPVSAPAPLSPLSPLYYEQNQNQSHIQNAPPQPFPPSDFPPPSASVSAASAGQSQSHTLSQSQSQSQAGETHASSSSYYAQIGSIAASSSASSPRPGYPSSLPLSPAASSSPPAGSALLAPADATVVLDDAEDMDGDAEFAYPADVDDHARNTDATDADVETHTSGGGGWALWSRRPRDPARAPGVIISPAAHPPPDVVAGALGERTPPASPVLKERVLLQAEMAVDETHREGAGGRETSLEADTAPPSSGASTIDDYTTDADADADARRTPTTAATTMPSSPLSASITVNIPSKLVEVVESKVKTESTPAAAVSSTATGSAPAVPSATAPESAPTAAPAPIAPKKSWASLLRPAAPAPASASASSTTTPTSTPGTVSPANGAISTTAPRKNGLPTSSVVGFSVPASQTGASSGSGSGVQGSANGKPIDRAALLALLAGPSTSTSTPSTGAPAAFSYAAASAANLDPSPNANANLSGLASGERLVPRGLVNTGNMCFANAVLQVLVCCPPFAALVGGLRGVLGPVEATAGAYPSLGNGSGSADAGVGTEAKVASPWAAPLLRATGEFLREFVVDARGRGKGKGRAEGKDTKAANGSGNGKEKGKGRAEAEEEDEEGEAFIPTYVYDALKGKKRFDSMRGGHQEDAEEFLGFYLDALEEELLALGAALEDAPRRTTAVTEEREEEAPGETEDGWLEVGRKNRTVMTRTIKSAESPITRIFGGKFRSTLRAPGTKDSVIVEDWRSLRLDIQRDGIHTIEDALAFISHPQAVQLTHPARPGAVLDASQQVLIDALPPVLVLHVKRFCYDAEAGGVIKIGKQVTFGPELDIGSDVMAPTARKPARYKLFGVVYHHGVSASGGHYTLDVLHPARFPSANASLAPREGWVRIDDELVSDVRPDDVFGATARDDSRCAYLLFYRRVR